jgi:DNA-binding NarL/FixJ family response regulator
MEALLGPGSVLSDPEELLVYESDGLTLFRALADFVAAVKRVAGGGSALDPSVVSQLVGRRRSDDPLDQLTPREREVLELMAEGLSNSAIAARIFLTERGVEKHVTSIFQKLRLPVAADTHRRVLAVVAFLQS